MKFEMPELKDPKHIYLQIADIIEKKITEKGLPVGYKFPTEEELCKTFRVSLKTIKAAMGKLAERGLISRRRRHGTVVINSRQTIESGFLKSKDIEVFVCVDPINPALNPYTHPYYSKIFSGVFNAAHSKGVSLKHLTVDLATPLPANKFMNSAGIIVLGIFTDELVKKIKKLHLPFILVNDIIRKGKREDKIDVIGNDDFEGGYLAAKHLIGLGHKKILYVVPPMKGYPWEIDQLKGFEKAHEEAGIAVDKKLELEVDYDISGVIKLLKKPLSFTGLVTSDDGLTCALTREIKERGLNIPEDISVVCISGGEENILMYEPDLTVITSNTGEIGKMAFERLMEKIISSKWEPKRVVVKRGIIVNKSTKKLVDKGKSVDKNKES